MDQHTARVCPHLAAAQAAHPVLDAGHWDDRRVTSTDRTPATAPDHGPTAAPTGRIRTSA
ncbi:hypothetical protein SEA_BABULLSEYE_97 [Mycobacterium phage BABullseye]|nr:hypothetical protein SEA_BABULLSEYE_97 [Mycobacterium phage BABullseye]